MIMTMAAFPSSKAKTFLIFGLFAFLTLFIFGLGYMNGMKLGKNGDMEGCIFTGKIMLCKMSVIEHISLWQGIFTATPQERLTLLALFALLVVAIFVTKNILAPPRLSRSEALTKRFYLRGYPDLLFFNPLKKMFSQGILHPKIYDTPTL